MDSSALTGLQLSPISRDFYLAVKIPGVSEMAGTIERQRINVQPLNVKEAVPGLVLTSSGIRIAPRDHIWRRNSLIGRSSRLR